MISNFFSIMKGAIIKKPKKPDYLDLPYERIPAAFDRYERAKEEYRRSIVEEIKKTGLKGVSLERLRVLLQSEGIVHRKSSRPMMEWRYERFLNGQLVLRTRDHLKTRDLPDYLLLEPNSSMGAGLPLDVWTHYIFPHLTSHEVWAVGKASRQFQKRAHAELMRRAQARYGSRGTPMAILLCENPYTMINKAQMRQFHMAFNSRYMSLVSVIAIVIETFGCLDYCKTFPAYREEQKKAEAEDSSQETTFTNQAIAAINQVSPLLIKFSDQRAQFEDLTAHRIAHFLHWPAQSFLARCTALINQGDYCDETIRKTLEKRFPHDFEMRILKWAALTNLSGIASRMVNYGKGSKWNYHGIKRNVTRLFDALYVGYELFGGMDWLENTAFSQTFFQPSVMDAPDCCFIVGKHTFHYTWSPVVMRNHDKEYYEAQTRVYVEGSDEKRARK